MANLTQLIGGAQELHAYSVRRLYSALAQDISQVMFPPPRLQAAQPSQPFPSQRLLTPGSQWFFPLSHNFLLSGGHPQGQSPVFSKNIWTSGSGTFLAV